MFSNDQYQCQTHKTPQSKKYNPTYYWLIKLRYILLVWICTLCQFTLDTSGAIKAEHNFEATTFQKMSWHEQAISCIWWHCEREPEWTHIYAQQTIHAQGWAAWQQTQSARVQHAQAQGCCKGPARAQPLESKGDTGPITAGQRARTNELEERDTVTLSILYNYKGHNWIHIDIRQKDWADK